MAKTTDFIFNDYFLSHIFLLILLIFIGLKSGQKAVLFGK